MDKLYTLIEKGIAVRAFVTVVVTLVFAYMVLSQTPVPDYFEYIAGTIYGYLFGSEAHSQAQKLLNGSLSK